MPVKRISELDIFLSSCSSDVLPFRDVLENFIRKDYNDNHSTIGKQKIKLVPKKWEDIGITAKKPRNLIKPVLENSDILLAVIWNDYGVGTFHEITSFLEKKKPIIIYFITAPPKSQEESLAKAKGMSKILQFKNTIKTMDVTYREIEKGEDITYHLAADIKTNVESVVKNIGTTKKETTQPGKNAGEVLELLTPWFEKSVTGLIESYLIKYSKRDNIDSYTRNLRYNKRISYSDNLRFWKEFVPHHYHPALEKTATDARAAAFSYKYGNYNYKLDLRIRYKDWSNAVKDVINDHKKNIGITTGLKVLNVAGNYGLEIEEIFFGQKKQEDEFTIVELSHDAITRGRKIYGDKINFVYGNMESLQLTNHNFDVYINLRSIHSRGVSMNDAIMEAHKALKPGGIAIFSVSNGYLVADPDDSQNIKEEYGMYDSSKNYFSKSHPMYVATRIWQKLEKYEFCNIKMKADLRTEILIYGEKKG